jgi:hypothetical protein
MAKFFGPISEFCSAKMKHQNWKKIANSKPKSDFALPQTWQFGPRVYIFPTENLFVPRELLLEKLKKRFHVFGPKKSGVACVEVLMCWHMTGRALCWWLCWWFCWWLCWGHGVYVLPTVCKLVCWCWLVDCVMIVLMTLSCWLYWCVEYRQTDRHWLAEKKFISTSKKKSFFIHFTCKSFFVEIYFFFAFFLLKMQKKFISPKTT